MLSSALGLTLPRVIERAIEDEADFRKPKMANERMKWVRKMRKRKMWTKWRRRRSERRKGRMRKKRSEIEREVLSFLGKTQHR